MKTVIRIVLILLAALAVTGVTYAVSQSAWATAQFAGAPGGERSEGRPSGAFDPSTAASAGERPSGRGEGGEHGGGVNLFAFAAFLRILLPMALMIGAVTLIRAVAARVQRRRDRAAPATGAS